MTLVNWAVDYFFLFLLIMLRFGGLMVFAPFFGSQNIPTMVKVGFVGLLALAISPMLIGMGVTVPHPKYISEFVLLAMRELGLGLILGLSATLIFAAIQLAGHHIGQTMGFAIANIVDPISEAQVTIIGQLYFFLAVILFLVVDGHIALIALLTKSFQVVGFGELTNIPGATAQVSVFFSYMFDLSLRLAAPLLLMLVLLTVALGFIARTVPQMNVMVVGFPLQIAVGFVFLILMVPFLADIFYHLWTGFLTELEALIVIMGGG